MEFIAYACLVMMGVSLGLVGAGGSILTIPILVYMLNIPMTLAANYSFIIVGMSAMIASIHHRKCILFRKAIIFMVPSVIGVFGARYFLLPHLHSVLDTVLIDYMLCLLLLIFIAMAGYLMINIPVFVYDSMDDMNVIQYVKVILLACGLGIIIGLLGAGGGFLIIPVLVYFMGSTMEEATATSLVIISVNSFIGLASDHQKLIAMDWIIVLSYLGCSLTGMFIGLYMARFIQREYLKKVFGYIIWALGVVILAKEFILI